MTIEVKNLGQRIQALRESRSMTPKQLRMSRSHLWNIENGKNVPSLGTLEKVAGAFGIGMHQFFSKPDAEILIEDSFIRAILPLLSRLNVQHQQLILKTLQAAPRNSKRMRIRKGSHV